MSEVDKAPGTQAAAADDNAPDAPSDNYLVTENLQQMPPLLARGLLYVVAAALAVGLAYAALSKMDVVVECRAVARPVLPDSVGSSDREVSYGARIKDAERALPLKEEFYNNRMASAQNDLKNLAADTASRLATAQLNIEQKRMAQKTAASELAYWTRERDSAAQEYAATEELFQKKLTAIAEYNMVKSRLERARTEIEKINFQQHILIREISAIERDMASIQAVAADKRASLENELRNLGLEKTTTLDALRSDLDQSRKMLALKDGVRGSAESTASVDGMLYMQITVPNRDVGFIEKGMPVKYKVDAYPFSDYGILRGKVTALSSSAVEDAALGYVYHVRGTLERACFVIKGRSYPVKAGMTATAELVTERKSILSIMVGALKK